MVLDRWHLSVHGLRVKWICFISNATFQLHGFPTLEQHVYMETYQRHMETWYPWHMCTHRSGQTNLDILIEAQASTFVDISSISAAKCWSLNRLHWWMEFHRNLWSYDEEIVKGRIDSVDNFPASTSCRNPAQSHIPGLCQTLEIWPWQPYIQWLNSSNHRQKSCFLVGKFRLTASYIRTSNRLWTPPHTSVYYDGWGLMTAEVLRNKEHQNAFQTSSGLARVHTTTNLCRGSCKGIRHGIFLSRISLFSHASSIFC